MLLPAGCLQPRQGDSLLRVDHGGLMARMEILCSVGLDGGNVHHHCDGQDGERE